VAVIYVRYGIPAALILAGFVLLFTADGSIRWDGFAMCVGAGLAVLLMNVLFRFGAKGDEERQAEDEAREYFAAHGHWPDEKR
jgi:hypothetical protein